MKRFGVLALAGLAAVLATAAVATAAPSATKVTKIAVTAGKPTEFGFTLKKTVAHGAVTFTVTNKGNLPHDFKVCTAVGSKLANACAGKVTKMIPAGKTATLSVTLKAGKHEYLCTVPGHAAGGMKGILTVT